MTVVSNIRKFWKKPDEILPQFVRYRNRMPMGQSLASVTITAKDAQGNDITSTVIVASSTTILPDEQKVRFYVKNGAVGLRATIKVVAKLDNDPDPNKATTFVDYIIMLIRE